MKSRIERIEYISSSIQAIKSTQNPPTKGVEWRGKVLSLPEIRVDSDYLLYRLNNSRTFRQQLRYLRNHPELPKNFFTNDPEATEAQKAQEEILLQMIDESGQDFEYDLDEKGQEDPAIISYDGFIINGNRRVAALRKNNKKYIRCVMLPQDSNSKDFYEIEQRLQISRDFKEPYHWINELMDICLGVKDETLKTTEDDLARRLGLKKAELKAKIRTKDLVDKFLVWKSIPQEYDYEKLDDVEEIFRQLEKATRVYKEENEGLSEGVFTLIDERPVEGRLYGYVMALIKNYHQINIEIKKRIPNHHIKKKSISSKTEPFSELPEIKDDGENVFSDAKQAGDVSKTLIEVIADIKASIKGTKDQEAVYDGVSTALRELQGLSISDITDKIEGIKNKLLQIIDVSNHLMKQIKHIQK